MINNFQLCFINPYQIMEISWKWSSFYLCLLLFQLCNGRPINSENTLTDQQTKFLTGLVSVLLTVCGLVFLAGCLCCRRGNSFRHTRTLESDSEDGLMKSWFNSTENDFPRIKLKYIRELGKGWFGKVVEGAAQDINKEGHAWTPVVVRILDASSSQKEKIVFLQDAAIYKCGSHGNILRLIGRCLDTVPYLLLQEYCPQGDLKGYLRSKKSNAESFLSTEYPLLWCCQLTSALKHLHDNHVLHPDLASRNCQLTENLTLKLGDYGLAVFKYPNDYYQGSAAVPVRWRSPESLTYTPTTIQPKQITCEGNVWSLGVAMWEICECGDQPYSSLSDDEVISQVLGPPNVRLGRPGYSVLYTDYIFRLMQLCWTNAESRPTLTQINLMLADLLQVHRNTNSNATSSLLSADDFDERWESFKPNTIVKTDHVADSVSIEMNYPETKIRKSLSASLHNLHGSFEDLLVDNGEPPILFTEDDLRNAGFSSANDESLTSERIFNSDSSDQETATNKAMDPAKIGFENSLFDSKLFHRTSSGSETEDENWRNKVERGAYTEKVRLKSRSVADLMVLTHVDYSESESETPLPSLDYKVNNYKNVRLAPSSNPDGGNLTFGSEGNLLSIKDTFQEELKKLQEERKDSLLFVPDNLSQASFRVDENVTIDSGGSNQSNISSPTVANPSRLIQELNSPAEIKPAGQVFNVFNVTIDKYSPLDVNTKLTEIINFEKVPQVRSESEERDAQVSPMIIKTSNRPHENETCDKVENISSEDPLVSSEVNDSGSISKVDCVTKGSDSSEEDTQSNGTKQILPNECYQNETELHLVDSLEDDIDIISYHNDTTIHPANVPLPESSMEREYRLENLNMPLKNAEDCTNNSTQHKSNENEDVISKEIKHIVLSDVIIKESQCDLENSINKVDMKPAEQLFNVTSSEVRTTVEDFVNKCNETIEKEELHALDERKEEYTEMRKDTGCTDKLDSTFDVVKPSKPVGNVLYGSADYVQSIKEKHVDELNEDNENIDQVTNENVKQTELLKTNVQNLNCTIAELTETVENHLADELEDVDEIQYMNQRSDNITDVSNEYVNTNPSSRDVDRSEKPYSTISNTEPFEASENIADTYKENVRELKESEEMRPLSDMDNGNERIVEVSNECNDLKQTDSLRKVPTSLIATTEPCESDENFEETSNENVCYNLEKVEELRELNDVSRDDVNLPEISEEYLNSNETNELVHDVGEASNANEYREACKPLASLPDEINITYLQNKKSESHSLENNSEGSCDKIDNKEKNQDIEGKCVNFDLSDNQEEAMPNSLTHSVVFASTPFKKREISLPVEDAYSSMNLFGVPNETDNLDADFSMEFSQLEKFPGNKDLNYSLETWDNFLGSTLDHQNNRNENLFDSFSSEPKSLLFVDDEEVSSRECDPANKVLLNQTVVLPNNCDDGNEKEIQTEPNATYVMEKTEKTFVIDEKPNTSATANSTFVKEASNTDDQNVGSWENGGGWFLHPQTNNDDPSGEMQIQNTQTESYVGFGIDDEIMSAIRNELLSKLPHAQGATTERAREEDDWDTGERNEVFLRYNVYNTPLSPIPEESYVEEQSGMESIRQEGASDSDFSDRCISETLAPDTESQSAVTLESHFRGPHHRHTPSQDSCCSNDTLFNLEELNYGTAEHENDIGEGSEGESNNNVADNVEKTFVVEPAHSDKTSSPPQNLTSTDLEIDDVRSERTTSDPAGLDILNNFLVEERNHSLTTLLSPEKPRLTLDVSQSNPTKTQHVPLPSPEDKPWKQLPASLLSFDKVTSLSPSLVLEGEHANDTERITCTDSEVSSNKNGDEMCVENNEYEILINNETKPNIVPECAKISDQEFYNKLTPSETETVLAVNGSVIEESRCKNETTDELNESDYVNISRNEHSDGPSQDTELLLTQDEVSDENIHYENIEVANNKPIPLLDPESVVKQDSSSVTIQQIEEPHDATYVNIESSSSASKQESIVPPDMVSSEEHCYENCGVPTEYVNAMSKESSQVSESATSQKQEESAYVNCDIESIDKPSENIEDADLDSNTEDIYESINDTDPYDEYVNIVNMENTKNSLEFDNSDKDTEYMDIYRHNEDDLNSDNDSNIFGVLTDIRFSGPSDSQLMSTSFSENNGDDQEWDSGSDSRSSSSGEFIWKEGEHEESLKALTAAPQDLMENIKPLERITEDAYEESDVSSTFSDEEGETPEFVPSAWDKFAIPGKSVLRSPEKFLNKSEEKKPKGVWFKKQKYHCIYEYPKEPESPVLQSQDLWKPQPDFKSFADWEFDGESFLPPSTDDNDMFPTYSNPTNRTPTSPNLYQLTSIPDFIPDDIDDDKSQEFFISGSAQPFHSHSLSSQFFPGGGSTSSSAWTATEHVTPDSGVEDVTPASLVENNKYTRLLDSVPTLKQLAGDAVNRTKHDYLKNNKDVLGGMRHTRNKLKLDLPPSPSAFSSEKMFVIEPAPEPVVVREKPTFTTFGKSRFLVQHVDTPPDDSKSRNVSFEALPHKPLCHPDSPRSDSRDTGTKDDEHSNLCHMKIEVVKGEASVLDSGDEDSGIESSTLERKIVKNAQA